MKRYKFGIIGFLLLAVSIGILLMIMMYKSSTDKENNNECNNIVPESVTMKAQLIEDQKHTFATTSRKVFGKSTDGGVQINYTQDGELFIIEEGLFGETIQSYSSYYIKNEKVYYIHKEIIRYPTSVYQNNFDPNNKEKEVRDYYLDKNQNLCYWYSNSQLQTITDDDRNYVKRIISDLNGDQTETSGNRDNHY